MSPNGSWASSGNAIEGERGPCGVWAGRGGDAVWEAARGLRASLQVAGCSEAGLGTSALCTGMGMGWESAR
jgi:hypothetical protein